MTTSNAAAPQQSGSWVQTGPLSFSHSLSGADGAWEQISEVPTLTIPYAGVWEIAYHAHGNFSLPSNGAVLLIRTALYNNSVIIPGSEAVSGIRSSEYFGFQSTAGQTLLHTFAAQDEVALYAHREGPAAAVAGISSGGDGRTGVMAHWVSPGF
ncbi:hypothetical protein [Streptomyces himastatinicus]|uniref:hypothetical protein n=1 Tax=Streptomyces himastatinicus TaxID=998084 RepID=UPI0001B4FB1C|nr:hypothetical protein [Streptomyces himastatinicus]